MDVKRYIEALRKARRDQVETDYPGCARGVLFCRHTGCGCVGENRWGLMFLVARFRHHLGRGA